MVETVLAVLSMSLILSVLVNVFHFMMYRRYRSYYDSVAAELEDLRQEHADLLLDSSSDHPL